MSNSFLFDALKNFFIFASIVRLNIAFDWILVSQSCFSVQTEIQIGDVSVDVGQQILCILNQWIESKEKRGLRRE